MHFQGQLASFVITELRKSWELLVATQEKQVN